MADVSDCVNRFVSGERNRESEYIYIILRSYFFKAVLVEDNNFILSLQSTTTEMT